MISHIPVFIVCCNALVNLFRPYVLGPVLGPVQTDLASFFCHAFFLPCTMSVIGAQSTVKSTCLLHQYWARNFFLTLKISLFFSTVTCTEKVVLFFVFNFFAFRIIFILPLFIAPPIYIWLAITDVHVGCKTGLSQFHYFSMFQTILTYGRDEGRAPPRVLPLSNRQGQPHSKCKQHCFQSVSA